MIVSNGLAFLGGALMGLSQLGKSYEMMILGRFMIGAFSGKKRSLRSGRGGERGGLLRLEWGGVEGTKAKVWTRQRECS